jgi:hypothetical protein
MRKIGNYIRRRFIEGICFNRFHGADSKDGKTVESKSRNLKLVCNFINPGEQEICHDAIWWVLLDEVFDGWPEKSGGLVDFNEVVRVGCGGETFHAIREANFLGWKWNGVKTKVLV